MNKLERRLEAVEAKLKVTKWTTMPEMEAMMELRPGETEVKCLIRHLKLFGLESILHASLIDDDDPDADERLTQIYNFGLREMRKKGLHERR